MSEQGAMTPQGGPAKQSDTVLRTAYGVDGCSAGWFCFALARSEEPQWYIVGTVDKLVSVSSNSDRIFVDIPIGLPDGPEGRCCDREARMRLGRPRASSVFPAPVRAALAATTYEEANRISREESGKGITKQAFAILPKIKQVDELLRRSEKARNILREVHPEICFWALAGGTPMRDGKNTRIGFDERLALLERFLPSVGQEFVQIRSRFRRSDLSDDDILDAMAAAITASVDSDALMTLPKDPTRDSCGLPMEMVYAADWTCPALTDC